MSIIERGEGGHLPDKSIRRLSEGGGREGGVWAGGLSTPPRKGLRMEGGEEGQKGFVSGLGDDIL